VIESLARPVHVPVCSLVPNKDQHTQYKGRCGKDRFDDKELGDRILAEMDPNLKVRDQVREDHCDHGERVPNGHDLGAGPRCKGKVDTWQHEMKGQRAMRGSVFNCPIVVCQGQARNDNGWHGRDANTDDNGRDKPGNGPDQVQIQDDLAGHLDCMREPVLWWFTDNNQGGAVAAHVIRDQGRLKAERCVSKMRGPSIYN